MIEKHITHVRHLAGEFEEGMQLCRLCGEVLCDYTGSWASIDGTGPVSFPTGFLYVSGKNPTTYCIEEPKNEEEFEGDLSEDGEQIKYINKVIGCDNKYTNQK